MAQNKIKIYPPRPYFFARCNRKHWNFF